MTAASEVPVDPARVDPAVDPVTVEVVRRRLIAIANQVDLNITRTAFSPLVYEYKDYAVGIVDAEGCLLSQCTGGMPVFVADVLGAAVRDGLEIYGKDGIQDGDIVITNHAGTIGQHLNNVAMYTPVFDPKGGALVAFMVVVMHWLDIGGREIGSISQGATDIFMEGIQFRTVKLRARGEPVGEIYRMILHNTRFPEAVMGDIDSQIGGCLMGRDEVAGLVGRYGADVFRAAIETIWRQSEAAARAAIRAVPDGTYAAEAFMDDDGVTLDRPFPLKLKLVIAGDRMTIDLSELPAQVRSPMNAGRSGGGQSVARLAFRYVMIPHEHANEGSFRPLELILPEGTIVSAGPTAPMGKYNLALPTLIDMVIRALGSAIPDQVAAGHYGTFSTVQFVGRQPETGELFQCTDSGFGGWGALSDADGPGPFRTMCHGDTRVIPVEVQEASYPIQIDSFELKTDSGGAGARRGGPGLRKRYLALAPCTISTTFERTKCPPWGLNGGADGLAGSVVVERPDGSRQSAFKENIELQAGDRVLIDTGGGGGFGKPGDRPAEQVRDDVLKGYISRESAETVYGVRFSEDMKRVSRGAAG